MTANPLSEQKCKACEGGTPPVGRDEAESLRAELDEGWELNEGATGIAREFRFRNFYQTMAFVNAVAWVANREDHHPDLEVGYNRCLVQFTTHAIGGLSRNDFICAARIDRLLR